MIFPKLHTCPSYEEGQSVFWPLHWERPKKYEPSWLRLCEVNVVPIHTKDMDDVECFIAWMDYMISSRLTGFHASTTKYLTPVEEARVMLELVLSIDNKNFQEAIDSKK